jgi:lysophospholipase L1-like esterase
MRAFRNFITKALLVLSGLLISLLMLEMFLKLIHYNYTPLRIEVINKWSEWRYYFTLEDKQFGFKDKQFVYDPFLVWRPKKGGLFSNEQGYRGKEIPVAKESGSVQLFAIGDSNTLGGPGKDAPNWPMYLEQLLRKDSDRFIVINAGVWGYSSFQGVRRFREALLFQPDMVLISFGANDFLRVTMSDLDFANKKIRKMNIDHILMKAKIGQVLLAIFDKLPLTKKDVLIPRVSVQEYKDNLNEIVRLSKERSIKVVLLTRPFTGPSPSWWTTFAPTYNSAVMQVAQNHDIPVIDIYSYFEGQNEYFIDQSHFSESGHRVMARIIYEHIKPLLY